MEENVSKATVTRLLRQAVGQAVNLTLDGIEQFQARDGHQLCEVAASMRSIAELASGWREAVGNDPQQVVAFVELLLDGYRRTASSLERIGLGRWPDTAHRARVARCEN
jgi:hypothetical protein